MIQNKFTFYEIRKKGKHYNWYHSKLKRIARKINIISRIA